MSFGLVNLVVLAGLAAVAIPVLIHLLNRRRFDVVEWGAMQFLQVGRATRRRIFIEEILLLVLRMGLVALLVVALAAPFVTGPALADLAGRTNRDIVLVIDGAAGMGRDDGRGKTPHEEARAWAEDFLDTLAPGDGVAVLVAGQRPVPVLPELSHDHELVRVKLARLPRPYGGCDGPAAVREAHRLLAARGKQAAREVIVLTDGRRHGWADAGSLLGWERLAAQLRPAEEQGGDAASASTTPHVWVVTVGRPVDPAKPVPNYALEPLRPTRAVAWVGQRLRVQTAIAVTGRTGYEPPYRIRLEADGKDAGTVEPPGKAAVRSGHVSFAFSHRFTTPGAHLLSVVLEPDPPPGRRGPGAAPRDHLPGDNRQDLAVEVAEALPVLLVDGDARLTPEGSTYFLRRALGQSADARHPSAVRVRAVPARDFAPALLSGDLDPRAPGSRPRVVVLADVPGLTPAQDRAVADFLEGGGGVLVILGERVARAAAYYNRELYRGGDGWLPAHLDAPAGDPDRPDRAATVDRKQIHHPALELFRDEPSCTLDRARLPRWWKVSPGGPAAAVGALLTSGDPLLVERPHGKGKVLLCTVPLDRSWGAGLPGVWEFPVLAHELVYYLADTRSAEYNLQAGQPLRYRPAPEDAAARLKLPSQVLLFPPDGEPEPLRVERWPLVYDQTHAAGVYKLQPAGGRPAYYVVQPDPRGSDLAPCSAEDRARVAALFPVRYEDDVRAVGDALLGPARTQDLWWVALVGVIALLCGEVWLTRRMVAGREG
jgi:hypothetical protein